jgi:hypothetical protein
MGFWRYYWQLAVVIGSAVWRNVWATAITLLGSAVSAYFLGERKVNPATQTWIRTEAAWIVPISMLVIYLLFHALRAPWKVHLESEERVRAAEKTAEILGLNLEGCPLVILAYEESGPRQGLNAINRGASDARSVMIARAESPNLTLSSEPVAFLAAGARTPIKWHTTGKTSPSGECPVGTSDLDAVRDFAQDLATASSKLGFDPQDPLTFVSGWMQFANTHRVTFEVTLTYSDLSGKNYLSPQVIAWEPLRGRIEDVRPGVIRKVLRQP